MRGALAGLVSIVLVGCSGASLAPGAHPPAPSREREGEHSPAPLESQEVQRSEALLPHPFAEHADRPRWVNPCPPEVPDGMACVLGGSFVRGTDDGPAIERPAAEVFVSTFLMDTHETTNAEYRECVVAGVCQRSMPFPGYMADAQPAVAMRWADADAYCRWRDKRLPTEAEWERAASGPDDTRYPWGERVEGDPCELAIVRVRAGRGCGAEVTWPVGSRAPGPFGLYDMAGNVWEWVADHHSRCYAGCPRECGDACLGDNPRGLCGDPHAPCPEARGQRTVRGGSWWHDVEHATTTLRRGVPGANPNPHRFGFRCARDLEPLRPARRGALVGSRGWEKERWGGV